MFGQNKKIVSEFENLKQCVDAQKKYCLDSRHWLEAEIASIKRQMVEQINDLEDEIKKLMKKPKTSKKSK